MADPISDSAKILLVKLETEYGTDPTPTAGANSILATDFQCDPMEGEDESRNIQYPHFGNQEQIPNALRGVMSFATELAASGSTGVAPKWGPLLRACAVAEVVTPDDTPGDGTVVYSPISLPGQESVTVWFWDGPTRHIFTGSRGTATIEVPAQGIPRIRWTLTGLWNAPAAQAPVTPDFTGWQDPQIATSAVSAFEINSTPLVLRSATFDLGNRVDPRFLIGRDEILVGAKAESIAAVVEAVPLGTFDPFGVASARTKVPVGIVHGTDAGSIVTIAAPSCQLARPARRSAAQDIAEWPLTLRPLPVSGNDQWSITLT
jgi:hypothetical protein